MRRCGASITVAAMGDQTRTMLFSDIVGSTELRSRLGERGAERLRVEHFAMLREQLARCDGCEIKTLGDGVMASFALARSALDSAVAMQRASAVAIRVGISSGDVTLDGGDCFGTAVVEASRLCDVAAGGQVLVSETTRLLARDYAPLDEVGPLELKGLAEATRAWEACWSPDAAAHVRVVLADDAVLVREGIAHVLEAAGLEVLGQAGDGDELLRLISLERPDLAIVDLRMPPTYTVEGLEVAERICAEHPATAVLVLTQDLEPRHAARLQAMSTTGVGYLLKESVANLGEFVEAARHIAAGGTVFEPSVGVAT